MAPNPFKKATKAQLKARVALDGPTGSGKTWTMLEWLKVLAGGAPVAVVDTEHGSASLYADHFEFDVLTWDPPYEPLKLADTIRQAQAAGYAALGLDSLSHFWEGEGGTLDMVDAAAQKAKGNSYVGWKVGTPALRHLIDTMLAADLHIVGTMRSKMEYVLEEDGRGKKTPRKVGMAPVMRAGVEYEFTLVGDLDLDHRLTFSKSRCPALADTLVQPGRASDAAEQFLGWLNDGEPMADPAVVADITSRLDALPTKTQRVEAKKQFVAHLALPTQLRADQVDDALTMVTRFEAEAAEQVSTPDGSGDRVADDPARDSALAQADGAGDPSNVDAHQGGSTPAPEATDVFGGDAPAYTREQLDEVLTETGRPPGQVMLKVRRLCEQFGEPTPTSLDVLSPGVLMDELIKWLKGEAA